MDSVEDQLKTQIETRERHCKETNDEQRRLTIREVYYRKLFYILRDNGLL